MRTRALTLVVYLLLVGGCQPTPPPEPPVAPPAEDLSHWTVPVLVQPPHGPAPPPGPWLTRPGTETEKVYEYVPGQVYKVTVALDAPLDVILEAGEKVQTVLDSDPKPIVQGPPAPENGTPKPEVQGAVGVSRKRWMAWATRPGPISSSGPWRRTRRPG